MFGKTNVGTVYFKIASNKGAFTKEVKSSASSADSVFKTASRNIGGYIKSAFAVTAVLKFGKACVSTAIESQNAWQGLSSILNGQGKSFDRANSFIQSYIKDGLVPLNNAVTAYKNLAARGYDTSQIESVMNALKDSAAYGRAASYSYGDAIQTATEGLKNENSILVDNAGVTKNVAKMWDDYAKSVGTTSANLTQQQKIQAEVNGILEETKWQMGDAAKYSSSFAGRLARLSATFTSVKTNIGNLIIPIANVFIPIIQRALDAVNSFALAMQSVFSALGFELFDISSLNNATSVAIGTADAITSTGTAAEKAAKKIKKAFASYDEINVLGTGSSDSSSGSGVSPNTAFSPSSGSKEKATGFDTSEIESGIASVTALVSTALLAVGAILTFTGANLPLGIALMAAGAVGLATAVAIDWTSISKGVSTGVDLVATILSGALLVVGGILTLTNVNPALGVALMAAGAVGLATTVAINWNSVSSNIKTTIEVITKIVSIALLAIGAIIAFSNAALPLGIALIAAGAVGLVASVALNWNASTNKVSEVITTITAVVGGGLLAIGAILAFAGITGLGIGLIAAGAVTLAASVAPSWDSMPQKTKNIIGIISGVVGSALLVLGAILLFSNANPALGLGLMVAGGATLAAAIAPNWNTIVEKVKSVWKSIKTYFNENIKPWFTKAKWNDLISKIFSAFSSSKFVKQIKNIWSGIKTFWNDNIAPWFTKEKWKSLAEKCGDGLKSGFKSAINSVISFFETMINRVIDKFNSISFTVPDWIPAIGGNTYGLSISKVSIPRLAQGGWVAANNPQLAIIGDNTREGEIVTPESKIYEQVMKALKAMGGTISGAAQTVKLAIELVIRYPDGRTIIKQINEAQIQEGRILLEV